MAEIGRTPLMTAKEERALLKSVKEIGTDSDEMKRLEQANMKFVVSLIAQYQHRGLTLEELIEVAKTGLRGAIVKYDLEANNKLAVETVRSMRQHIELAIKESESGNK